MAFVGAIYLEKVGISRRKIAVLGNPFIRDGTVSIDSLVVLRSTYVLFVISGLSKILVYLAILFDVPSLKMYTDYPDYPTNCLSDISLDLETNVLE